MKAVVIGSGFSSLAASCYLAQAGFDVRVLEKNETPGGRARQLHKEGFTFDIGPTWYWMPDVFEKFFNDFGKKPSDYYQLDRLDPAYQVYFGPGESIVIPGQFDQIVDTFESYEAGSGQKLRQFMSRAEDNYNIAIKDLVYNPGLNPLEIMTPTTALKLNEFFSNIRGQVARQISDPRLRQILEFPVLFLGAKPGNTPGFYNFMNYADFVMGTWHPKGGMYKVVEGMVSLAEELGVTIETDTAVEKINVNSVRANSLTTNKGEVEFDVLISGADYHHTESLLPGEFRRYSEKYWDNRVFAPSALLFFVGFDSKLDGVSHHTLFFDTDFDTHAVSIYDSKTWPEDPLFYASFPTITDSSMGPEGKEGATFLIPLAPGLDDTQESRDRYFDIILQRMETLTGQSLRDKVLFSESYGVNDFVKDYNSYKGNAYGLANTLMQTHYLRPRVKSNKLSNLYFTGQLTVPGPGVPPSLISGKVVSEVVAKAHKPV